MKNLISFKRHGKVTASRLPPKFLRNYRKVCPICVAMKKRRKSLPKGPHSAHELDHSCRWNKGTITSRSLYVLRQAIRLPFPMSSANIFHLSTLNSRNGLVDIQRYSETSFGNYKFKFRKVLASQRRKPRECSAW